MTVEQKVASLTTSVDQLTDAVNVKKQTLDATVADSESARDQSQGYRDEARTARDESQFHANDALGYSQDAASAVAYQDLTSISGTKAETAVDVFVYDTSQDSDGGTWRHRTQHTSWYNEPLNTATRGGRREFPAVAVIVAEADTQAITIYDGDDPLLPLWWKAKPTTTTVGMGVLRSSATYPPTSLAALNGRIVVGVNFSGGDFANNEGIHYLDFPKDEAGKHSSMDFYTGHVSPLSVYAHTDITADAFMGQLVCESACKSDPLGWVMII